MEAGLIGGKPCALFFHAPERTNGDTAIPLTVPGTTPMLQPHQFLRCLLDENLHGVLIRKPITTGDCVIGMLVQAVVRADDTRGSALCGDGVAPHRINLGNNCDTQVGIGFRHGDSSSQPGGSTTNQQNIMRRDVQHTVSVTDHTPVMEAFQASYGSNGPKC